MQEQSGNIAIDVAERPEPKRGRRFLPWMGVGVVLVILVCGGIFFSQMEERASGERHTGLVQALPGSIVDIINGSDSKFAEIVIALADVKNYTTAEMVLEKLSGENLKACEAYIAGCKAVETEDFALALDEFERTLVYEAGKAKFVNTALTASLSLIVENDLGSAREVLAKAAEVGRDDPEIVYACSFIIADTYFAEGNYSEAENLYKTLPVGYSFGDRMREEQLGIIKVAGTWRLSGFYIEEDAKTYTRDDLSADYDPHVLYSPDGRWVGALGGIGAFGEGKGSWSIDPDYDGPDEVGLVFDKGTSWESKGSINGEVMTIYFSNSNDILTLERA